MLSKYLSISMLSLLVLFFLSQGFFNDTQASPTGNDINAGNYASIQDAVSALPDEGGTVFIPAGTYKISEPIIIDKSEVTLSGAGSGTILLNTSRESKNTIELTGEEDKRIWRVQVSNMHLKGNENSGHAVYAQYVNEMWIDYHGNHGSNPRNSGKSTVRITERF